MSDKERHRINETDPVLDPEAGGPVQRAIGEWLLSVTSINPLVPGGRPPIIYGVMKALRKVHSILD